MGRLTLVRRDIGNAVLVILLAYSIAHTVYAAGRGIIHQERGICRGDFYASFPAPVVANWNPALMKSFDRPEHTMNLFPGKWMYGPAMHAITLPLTLLPSRVAVCAVWEALNLGIIAVAGWLLFGALFTSGSLWPVGGIYWLMWLNFYPLLDSLSQGNIEILELLLLTAAFVLLRRGGSTAWRLGLSPDTVAGILIGVAAMTKFLPAIFIPYLLVKKTLACARSRGRDGRHDRVGHSSDPRLAPERNGSLGHTRRRDTSRLRTTFHDRGAPKLHAGPVEARLAGLR